MIFQLGTRPGMRVFLCGENFEPITEASKASISVYASSPGGDVLTKVANGAYNLKPLGRGWYNLELPATMFRTVGAGCYEVEPKNGQVWRDTFSVVFDNSIAMRSEVDAA